ncbi:MAG: hypothetical protein U0L42_03595 [Methanobrevibacter sp.]|nr:hypothetical protein [Methanobrevibacter sp.]
MDDKERSLNNLNEIYRKIREIFSNVKPHDELPLNELVDLYSQDKTFLKDLEYIRKYLSEINNILVPIDELNKEYFCFFSIKLMIDYLINDFELFIVNLSFIENLLVNFFNLIHLKSLNPQDYEKKYDEFFCYLEKQKEFFYTEIYDYDGKYQDVIIEINNLLW